MYEIEVVLFVGIAAAVAGLLLGAGLHRSVGTSSARLKRLKSALEKAEELNRSYHRDVAEHFSETASLLNGLTMQYKNIHDHLAAGADKLCRDEAGHSLLAGAPIQLSVEERRSDEDQRKRVAEANLQPPLDYAPKGKSRSGTLSEEYGLEKVKLDEAETSNPSSPDPQPKPEQADPTPAARFSNA